MKNEGLSELQRKLIVATQAGLPLGVRPFQAIADAIGTSETVVLEELRRMKEKGLLRRVAVVPNHYRLGYKFNGMTVWNVAQDQVATVGKILGEMTEVSHCYERPRAEPRWRYNVYAMIHGKSKDQVMGTYEGMKAKLHGLFSESDILFSTQILKKTGLRIRSEKTDV